MADSDDVYDIHLIVCVNDKYLLHVFSMLNDPLLPIMFPQKCGNLYCNVFKS